MIDLKPIFKGELSLDELTQTLTQDDFRNLTNEMIDTVLGYLADCTDADVVFEPSDPEANDPYAVDEADTKMAWTLGHVIVHTTASAEESAAIAAELARGVAYHGRCRSEVPWESITTIQQCRDRLEESRRMRLASLEMWPDKPNLDLYYKPWSTAPDSNAKGRFALGFAHDNSHLEQIQEIIRQAKVA